jgi:acetyl esterase/lipase
MRNPEIKLASGKDIFINFHAFRTAGIAYAENIDIRNPFVSPLYGEVKTLPPMLIQAGTSELLLSDIRKFYTKCIEKHVKVQYEEYKNMFHVFPLMHPMPEAKKAQKSQLDFILK